MSNRWTTNYRHHRPPRYLGTSLKEYLEHGRILDRPMEPPLEQQPELYPLRRQLIEDLFRVVMARQLDPETHLLTIEYLDAYTRHHEIPYKDYYLMGLASLVVATRDNEPPNRRLSFKDVLEYIEADLLALEIEARVLKANQGRPDRPPNQAEAIYRPEPIPFVMALYLMERTLRAGELKRLQPKRVRRMIEYLAFLCLDETMMVFSRTQQALAIVQVAIATLQHDHQGEVLQQHRRIDRSVDAVARRLIELHRIATFAYITSIYQDYSHFGVAKYNYVVDQP